VLATLRGMTTVREDGRLKRGRDTRRAILARAVDIASAEGLEGLSLARLAAELDISKSGLFAHFGSKEDLQLATIDAARAIFVRDVVLPALERPEGLPQVWAACSNRLDYMHTAFSGGCFFYAVNAEFDARPGRVRDRIAGVRREWLEWLESLLGDAQARGHVEADLEPADLAFQLDAFACAANGDARLQDDEGPLLRAREITLQVLRRSATDPSLLPRSAKAKRVRAATR
jgi:AcrR family transcriptional regulator